jgi:3-hydroxyisobutyrate dehydrogenase-like beta-hydroxyacid dehydrogenase
MTSAGIDFVDGSIIGPPAWTADRTWLYLSGHCANQVASCFSGGPLEVEMIGSEVGKASALKMCFAANSKGTTALLTAIMAAADRLGVRQELENQWSRHGSDFTWSTIDRIRKATPKGWRFSGEMDEIASTFGAVGLPEGFHLAAADIYQRLDSFKDAGNKPSLEDIIDTILAANPVRFKVDKRDNG